jgi:hypothetical protein
MGPYSKAIIAVLGAIASLTGWVWMDNVMVGSISTILSAALVYAIPNRG